MKIKCVIDFSVSAPKAMSVLSEKTLALKLQEAAALRAVLEEDSLEKKLMAFQMKKPVPSEPPPGAGADSK